MRIYFVLLTTRYGKLIFRKRNTFDAIVFLLVTSCLQIDDSLRIKRLDYITVKILTRF